MDKTIDKITRIIEWFNGKKTFFGFALLAIATGIIKYHEGSGTPISDNMNGIITVMQWIGGGLGVLGGGHKIMKGDLSKSAYNSTEISNYMRNKTTNK